MIRVLLVDDEPLALEALRLLLADQADIDLIGTSPNGREAVHAIRSLRPDLVLLDVQMPVLDGFEVIEELEPDEVPVVVFVTAFDQYSLRAFAVHAVDYLLKPVDPDRFHDALDHARGIIAGRQEHEANQGLLALLEDIEARRRTIDRFVVRDRDRVRFVKTQDVDALEAADVYVVLHRGHDTLVLRDALSAIEARVSPDQFIRVHRSWLVNTAHVAEIRAGAGSALEIVLGSGLTVPVSRRHRADVIAQLGRRRGSDRSPIA